MEIIDDRSYINYDSRSKEVQSFKPNKDIDKGFVKGYGYAELGFKSGNPRSFFISIEDGKGYVNTFFGSGFKERMAELNIQIGDAVKLSKGAEKEYQERTLPSGETKRIPVWPCFIERVDKREITTSDNPPEIKSGFDKLQNKLQEQMKTLESTFNFQFKQGDLDQLLKGSAVTIDQDNFKCNFVFKEDRIQALGSVEKFHDFEAIQEAIRKSNARAELQGIADKAVTGVVIQNPDLLVIDPGDSIRAKLIDKLDGQIKTVNTKYEVAFDRKELSGMLEHSRQRILKTEGLKELLSDAHDLREKGEIVVIERSHEKAHLKNVYRSFEQSLEAEFFKKGHYNRVSMTIKELLTSAVVCAAAGTELVGENLIKELNTDNDILVKHDSKVLNLSREVNGNILLDYAKSTEVKNIIDDAAQKSIGNIKMGGTIGAVKKIFGTKQPVEKKLVDAYKTVGSKVIGAIPYVGPILNVLIKSVGKAISLASEKAAG